MQKVGQYRLFDHLIFTIRVAKSMCKAVYYAHAYWAATLIIAGVATPSRERKGCGYTGRACCECRPNSFTVYAADGRRNTSCFYSVGVTIGGQPCLETGACISGKFIPSH